MQKTTVERIVEDRCQKSAGDYLIYLFHSVTYEFSRTYVASKEILDYGCGSGSGYGTARLAADCQQIVGIDVSAEAVEYALANYSAPNLSYKQIQPAEEQPLPFDDASFDVVLSFQANKVCAHHTRCCGLSSNHGTGSPV